MSHHIALLKLAVGAPGPLGASIVMADDDAQCWNFAVFAPDASKVTLC